MAQMGYPLPQNSFRGYHSIDRRSSTLHYDEPIKNQKLNQILFPKGGKMEPSMIPNPFSETGYFNSQI